MAFPLSSRLEAVLFAGGEAFAKKRLMTLLGISADELDAAITELHAALDGSGLALISVEDMVELRTAPESADDVQKLRESELSRDLGKASLETLALVLYKGSATRGEIDWVRGVNSGTALRALLLRGLVERTEDAADKRRARYRPTVDALAHLGVTSLNELPRFADLSKALAEQETKQEAALTATDV
jgi:segregation and condensation protein B